MSNKSYTKFDGFEEMEWPPGGNAVTIERDALRKCVGDIQYYFNRWDGIPPECREWLQVRIAKANAECELRAAIAKAAGTP